MPTPFPHEFFVIAEAAQRLMFDFTTATAQLNTGAPHIGGDPRISSRIANVTSG